MGNMQAIFVEPAKTIVNQIQLFLVDLSLVLIILFIGWLISKFLRVAVTKILKLAKVDMLSEKVELSKLLEKGEYNWDTFAVSNGNSEVCRVFWFFSK